MVGEAVSCVNLLEMVLVSETMASAVVQWADEGINLVVVSDHLVAHLAQTETSQGIWAICRQPSEVMPAPGEFSGLLLILAGIQDPGNLGTMLRTAWGLGVEAVLLTTGTVDPFNSKVIRASMGASFKLPIYSGVGLEYLAALKQAGYRLLVCDAGGNKGLSSAELTGRTALVMGNEGQGFSPEWRAAADETISIPLDPGVDSLNVGVACGIVLYEAWRQRNR